MLIRHTVSQCIYFWHKNIFCIYNCWFSYDAACVSNQDGIGILSSEFHYFFSFDCYQLIVYKQMGAVFECKNFQVHVAL